MGKPILLLRLEGPLQSWGVRSRWDVRDTATEPTKSGVIGLLGCALGYPMRDARLETLSEALRFGVRVEHRGTILTDYQTVTDFLPTAAGQWKSRGGVKSLDAIRREGDAPATIISPRVYIEDGAFLVALEARSGGDILSECAHALKRPKWPLFLGRKACIPTRPLHEYLGDDYNDLDDALARHPWEWLGARRSLRSKPANPLVAFIEDETGDLTRQDAIRINASRTYGFRAARRAQFAPVFGDVSTPGIESGATEVA